MARTTIPFPETTIKGGVVPQEKTRDEWRQLRVLLKELDKIGPAALPPQDVIRLETLYVTCLADLGQLRQAGTNQSHERNLNDLLARAYGWIYRPPPRDWKDVLVFLLLSFPQAVQKRIHYIIVATLIFLSSMLIGFLGVGTESKLVDLVVTPELRILIQNDLDRIRRFPQRGTSENVLISSHLLLNNVSVAAKAFAFGILAGIGTVYILVFNGLLLGGLAAMYHDAGSALVFWSLILPHGFFELAGICIAGGAGFIIGYALLVPGLETRSARLGKEAQAAAGLLLGTVPLFLAAALVETYLTPADIGEWLKFLAALGSLTVLGGYFAAPQIKDVCAASLLNMRSTPRGSAPPDQAPGQSPPAVP